MYIQVSMSMDTYNIHAQKNDNLHSFVPYLDESVTEFPKYFSPCKTLYNNLTGESGLAHLTTPKLFIHSIFVSGKFTLLT